MKKYIDASSGIKYLSGSYLVDRSGDLYEVALHAPSTTYLDRGLEFLSPTDAGFLYSLGKISAYEVEIVLWYNYQFYLDNYVKVKSLLDPFNFSNWAELQYTDPQITKIFHVLVNDVATPKDYEAQFEKLNHKWYRWLQNNFVKLSVINTVAEFRITSEDSYDWNGTIIDDVILNYSWKPGTRFNILKEDVNGYRSYFFNASLDDILEEDDIVLSTTYLERSIVGKQFKYRTKEI